MPNTNGTTVVVDSMTKSQQSTSTGVSRIPSIGGLFGSTSSCATTTTTAKSQLKSPSIQIGGMSQATASTSTLKPTASSSSTHSSIKSALPMATSAASKSAVISSSSSNNTSINSPRTRKATAVTSAGVKLSTFQKPNKTTAKEEPKSNATTNNKIVNDDDLEAEKGFCFDNELFDAEINLDDNDEEFQKFLNSDLIDDRFLLLSLNVFCQFFFLHIFHFISL